MKKTILSILLILSIFIQLVPVFAVADEWDPFNGDKEVNIVYIGGSLTQANGWRVMLGDYLKEKYEGMVPGRTINNINAGVGGTGSLFGLVRLNEDVISKNPDMVFVEFSVNDTGLREEEIIKSAEGIVRRLQSMEKPPIINFIYTHPASMVNVSEVYSKIAEYYNIPEIDFTKRFNELGYYVGGKDAGINYYYIEDKVHANVFGHTEWTEYAKERIEENPQKYFRHSALKQVPYNKDNYSWISCGYISAAEALTKNIIKTDNVHADGEDLIIEPGGSISMEYSDKALAVFGELGPDNSVAQIYINGNFYTSKDMKFEGRQDMTIFLSANIGENSTIEIKTKPTEEKPIRVQGFYINDGEAVKYPEKYADDVVLNKWHEEKNETVEAKASDTYFELLSYLGFLQGCAEAAPEKYITRGEFAKILSNIYEYIDDSAEKWKQVFLENGTAQSSTIPQGRFSDINADYMYYNEVNFCADVGLLNGTSNGTFLPDNNLTLIQASKVIIDMLGYKKIVAMTGGYPQGYRYVLGDLGLNDGISAGYDDNITYEQLAGVIYNALDEYMVSMTITEGKVYFSESEKTFAEKVLDLKRVKGQMTENEYTTFAVKKNIKNVVIDGVTLSLPECLKNANDMIGREVVGYYSKEDSELKFIKLTERDDIVVIKAEDEPKYDGTSIRYFDKNKERTKKIKNGAYVIYNGVAVTSYDAELFNIKNGSITLLKTENTSAYDLIIINGYVDYFISAVDAENQKLYMREKKIFKQATGEYIYVEKNIDFKDAEIISFVDAENNAIDFSDIKKETVISVAENDGYYKLIYSDKKLEAFYVTGVAKGDYTVIKNDSEEYEVEDAYINNEEFPKLTASATYDLYLNAFGRVVWAKGAVSDNIVAGILIKPPLSDDDMENRAILKLSCEDGAVRNYSAEKVRFKNEKGNTSTLKNGDAIINALGTYKGLIRYKINEQEEITYIEVPITDKKVESQNGQPYDYNKVFNINPNSSYYYTNSWSSFSGENEYMFYLDRMRSYIKKNNIVLFLKDELNDSTGRYFCRKNDMSILNGASYNANLYGTDPDCGVAEYIVIEASAGKDKTANPNSMYIVESISSGLYGIDEEPADMVKAKKISGTSITDVTLFSRDGDAVDNNGAMVSKYDYCPDYASSGKHHKVEKGDIIMVDFAEGEEQLVNNVSLIFDANDTNNVPNNANPGWLAGANPTYDSTSKYNNPYAFTSSGTVEASEALKLTSWTVRVSLGYVLAYNNNVFRYTTKDLSAMNYNDDTSYVEDSIAFGNGKNICITYKPNGKFEVKNTTASDIKTYKTYGKNASRILTITNRGDTYAVILMNYDD